ncbi:MAG TPA: HAD family hydrolase [bacterium]|nr:HAD family hydrolase [bacterium]HOL47704.1 HAD family hydrolase [bacterium]HPQ19074.1 HAD family hydrolase [bacterium]
MENKSNRKAIFLDRDGTIIKDNHYVHKIKDVEFYKCTFEALRKMQEKGYLLFITSNQAGIGRGYYTEKEYYEVTNYILNELLKNGVKITKTYFAPYYENAIDPKYRQGEHLRKPNIGMLLLAQKEFNIDFKKSFMIGDKITDIIAGKNAGCKTIFVLTGQGKKELEFTDDCEPDYICKDIGDAVRYI